MQELNVCTSCRALARKPRNGNHLKEMEVLR